MPRLKLHDVELNYYSIGSGSSNGTPFVLIHGLAANLAFWYPRIASTLAGTRQVVMFDLRGHGRSSMPRSGYSGEAMTGDLCALLDHLRVERAHVVGHSFGGNIALHFANLHLDRVERLTLADVRVRTLQPRIDLDRWIAWPRCRSYLEQLGIEIDESADDVGFELFERVARVRLEQPERMQRLLAEVAAPFVGLGGEATARRWLELLDTTAARKELASGARTRSEDIAMIHVPCQLIYGEYSQALPTAFALQKILPEAHLKLVPKAGHFFPGKYPEKIVEPLLAFADGSYQAILEVAAQ